jgi:hypothetical protein
MGQWMVLSRMQESELARRAQIAKQHARRLSRLRQRVWLSLHRAESAARKRLIRSGDA